MKFLFPIDKATFDDIPKTAFWQYEKGSFVRNSFLCLVFIGLLFLKNNLPLQYELIAVLPAVICCLISLVYIFMPVKNETDSIIRQNKIAAAIALDLAYSLGSVYFITIPVNEAADLNGFLAIFFRFLLSTFVFLYLDTSITIERIKRKAV